MSETSPAEASEEITFIPPGKLRCVITDRLRNDTPEENVRQRVARSLINEYGYSREDIAVEFTVSLGSSKKRVDLAIFAPGVEHEQQDVNVVIECKREEIKPTDRDNGVAQLQSYMSACLNCRFGMWVGSEIQAWEKAEDGQGKHNFLEAVDIPRFGSDAPQPPRFADLVPAETDLQAVFRRCHNYIYGNQGLQKEAAFNELLKLIFCKVQDELDLSNTLKFFIGNEERRSALGQEKLRKAIEGLLADVRSRYPYIFGSDTILRLNNQVLAYIVGELQRYSLIQTQADVKGVAYEQLVGSNLRGDRGEFFTPRNVCKMAAEMVLATFPQDEWLSINVLDPAAGTGGFLVALMNVWTEYIRVLARERWGENDWQADAETTTQLKEIASSHLFGIDFNPVLVQAAQMNLVMQGDGSTNVFHANSLLPAGEWPRDDKNNVQQNIRLNHFDAILTNPPFGAYITIDDPHILEQFEVARLNITGQHGRGGRTPEQLFIERCLQLLRPGGRLAIVLPDSILSNPGLTDLRRWLLSKARVIASIDLPQETFEPYTGTQTSVLLLQKKTAEEMAIEREVGYPRDYEVFMAMPRAVGHDRRGNPLYLRTPEGHVIEQEETIATFRRSPDGNTIVERPKWRRPVIHDELPAVVESFRAWVGQPDRRTWLNG